MSKLITIKSISIRGGGGGECGGGCAPIPLSGFGCNSRLTVIITGRVEVEVGGHGGGGVTW